MAEVLDYAERRTRACIAALARRRPRRARRARGAPRATSSCALSATVAGERLLLDFTGSAAQHDGNLNCPLAVTRSACYFAVRVLTDPDIPPSAGAYRPVEVRAPEGSLLNARSPAAVAAGNVETSSRVADLVLAAFGRALGQGTMNNLTLGNDDFTYYETLGGGQGACPDADGPSGVHVAMSNTLNTPSRRSSSSSRCAWSSTRCGAAPAARALPRRRRRRARARGARADELLADHRAPPSRAARRGRRRARAPAGATCSTARRCRRRRAARSQPGQRLRIETPGGGGVG